MIGVGGYRHDSGVFAVTIPVREALVTDFAKWVASCAVRSNAPVRSRSEIYNALDAVDFTPLFIDDLGRIDSAEFRAWHRAAIANMQSVQPKLNVGWAAKILNEYTKTKCYVGGYGRDGLADTIHPPIDNGLISGLKNQFGSDPDLGSRLDALERMSDLDTYHKYEALIRVCARVAELSNCSLLESEQFWE